MQVGITGAAWQAYAKQMALSQRPGQPGLQLLPSSGQKVPEGGVWAGSFLGSSAISLALSRSAEGTCALTDTHQDSSD